MATIAGFAVQDPTSTESKVYAALAYRDSGGIFRLTTASGGDTRWFSNRMRSQQNKTFVSPAETVDALARVWKAKAAKSYSHILAGPTTFEINGLSGEIDPSELVNALKSQAPVFNADMATVTAVAQSAVGANAGVSTSVGATTATPAHSRTRLTLPDDEKNGIELPDGKVVYSREVAGHSDVAMLRHLRGTDLYVRLFGPPGGGKSTIPYAAFGDDLVVMQGHGDMTVSHFVGQYLPTPDGGFKWSDGPLAVAMREGKVFYLDEASRVPSETMAVLMPVADGRRTLHVDDRPDSEPITAADGFWMVIGYNESGMGVRPLDDAIKRRFPVAIEVSADFTAAEAAGVDARAVKVARNLHTQAAQDRVDGGFGCWVPQIADLLVFQRAVDAGLGVEVALATLVSACTDPDSVETLQETISAVFGMAAQPLALGGRA